MANKENERADYELERSVGFMMGMVYRKMSAFFLNRIKAFGVTPEQWSVLFQIDRHEGRIQKEIADMVGKDKPTTTRILDLLEAKGLVRKQVGESDKRSFQLYITEEGRKLVRHLTPIEQQVAGEVMQCMSSEEADTFMLLLKRLDAHVEQTLKPE
ncbi:MarR family winged helix-turn-helix transcriptional regulator [Cohnella soli]|uniref:MarR family winged helix-turn-helix transcriptional regulator n=1 Tax=Cohnella soli TaxID=425005 RepID=A0ABW0HVE9_9BACL